MKLSTFKKEFSTSLGEPFLVGGRKVRRRSLVTQLEETQNSLGYTRSVSKGEGAGALAQTICNSGPGIQRPLWSLKALHAGDVQAFRQIPPTDHTKMTTEGPEGSSAFSWAGKKVEQGRERGTVMVLGHEKSRNLLERKVSDSEDRREQ